MLQNESAVRRAYRIGFEDARVPGWMEYDYLTAPIVKATQGLHARVEKLESS